MPALTKVCWNVGTGKYSSAHPAKPKAHSPTRQLNPTEGPSPTADGVPRFYREQSVMGKRPRNNNEQSRFEIPIVRWPRRRAGEEERRAGGRSRRARRAGMVGPARPLFVLFGSSIVQYSFSNGGWGAILADVYARKADIMLRGYIGWNSRRAVEVVDKIFPKDALVQPSLVIVYFGGNDSIGPHPSGLGPHVPLLEYVENMKMIASHIKSLSEETRVIFLSCPPLNEEMLHQNTSKALSRLVRTNELCRRYSDACVELCKEMDVKVIDLWSAMQKRDDWLTACFTDGLHFSFEGSKIVVEEILKVLKEAEWQPSLHWKSLPTEFGEDSPFDLILADGKSTVNPSDWTFHREILWD